MIFFFCTLQNRFPWNTEALRKQMSFIKQKSKLSNYCILLTFFKRKASSLLQPRKWSWVLVWRGWFKTERHLIRIFGVYGVLSLILDITFASLMFFFWIHLYESRKKPTAIGKIQLTKLIFMIILNSLSYCFSTVLHSSVWMIKRATRKLPTEQFDTELKVLSSCIEIKLDKAAGYLQ